MSFNNCINDYDNWAVEDLQQHIFLMQKALNKKLFGHETSNQTFQQVYSLQTYCDHSWETDHMPEYPSLPYQRCVKCQSIKMEIRG